MSKALASFVSLISTASLSVASVQQFSNNEITPVLIAEEETQTVYSNKFGFDFLYHFASAEDVKNKDWWERVAKSRWDADKSSGIKFSFSFSSITNGYKGENSISKKCNMAYRKITKNEIHPLNDTSKIEYERDIWRYCSVKGELPITLEKSEDSEDKSLIENNQESIGKTGKQHLISTRDPRNEWFWKIQEEALNKKFNGNGENEEFTGFISTNGQDHKERCATLYKNTGTNGEKKKTNQASKFCSLIATKTQEEASS